MTTTAVTTAAARMDKPTLARRWLGLKNKLTKMKEVGEESGAKFLQGGITFGTFGALYYLRRRRQLKDQRVTFDEKGRVDAFFWPGVVLSVVGVTPLLGDAGKYIVSLGSASMCVGSVDYIANMAQEHHDKAVAGG